MQWFFIALAAPFLWALVNAADNYLVTRFSKKEEERSSGGLVLFSSLTAIFVALAILVFQPNVWSIPILDKILLLICGLLAVVWILLYLFSLELEETSAIVPWFLSVPVFGYILGFLFLGENLNVHQFIGSGIIFLGLILISIDFRGEKKQHRKKHILYMLAACIAIAVSGILFKYVTVENNFWISSFWEYVGIGLTGLFIFLFIPHYRETFMHMNRTGGHTILIVNIVSELLSIGGNLLTNWALILAPVAMVYLVGSFQPAILLILTILSTKFFPHLLKEDMSFKNLVLKIIAISIMVIGSIVLFL